MKLLEKRLEAIPMENYPRHSRAHPLCSFDTADLKAYIKREDELGFGLSGSKVRKFLSLIPYLRSEGFNEVIVIGTPNSNHVLSLSQVLKENRIRPVLFLTGRKEEPLRGNFLLTSLIVDAEDIHFYTKDSISDAAEKYVQKKAKDGVKVKIIPMGGNTKESLPGSLTLGLDILRNEKELNLNFDHIFIDAGTGMTAIAAILALAALGNKAHVHVIQVAGNEAEFETELAKCQGDFQKLIGTPLTSSLNYSLHRLQNAPSFGSVNAKVFATIFEFAQNEGILIDPIYNAKMFSEAKRLIQTNHLKGTALLIHSGGGLSLNGFQEDLAKYLARSHLSSMS